MKIQQNSLEANFILLLVAMAIIALTWLFSPFLPALFFSILIAISTYGYYEKLSLKLTNTKAALIMCLGCALILVLPIAYVFLVSSIEVSAVLQNINTQFDPDKTYTILEKLPFSNHNNEMIIEILKNNIEPILIEIKNISISVISSISLASIGFIGFVVVGIFSLFYWYIDGKQLIQYLKTLSPLEDKLDTILMVEFSQLSIILVGSVFIIAFIQGLVFGVGLSFIGLPALFFGVCMALASFIPILGGLIIWLPLSVYLLLDGQTTQGIFVIIWGGFLIGGIIDNMVRPWLIGKLSANFGQKSVLNHTLITVLSTLAGVIQLGILGLFVGPIIAAMAISIFHAYTSYRQ